MHLSIHKELDIHRVMCLGVLGIGQENHYRLSEGLNRLIIDCTIRKYVQFSINSNIHKRNILGLTGFFPCEILTFCCALMFDVCFLKCCIRHTTIDWQFKEPM